MIPSVTFSVSATEGQGSGVLGPEVPVNYKTVLLFKH